MPVAAFSRNGTLRLGKIFGDVLVDLSVAAPGLPRTIKAFLEGGAPARALFDRVGPADGPLFPLADVALQAPIPDPQKFLGIGMNYADHSLEAQKAGLEKPQYQTWFNKQVSCIVGPRDGIEMPAVSDQLDYEAELGVVIGQRCRDVPRDRAHEVIGGFLIVNDVSVRDWQFRTRTTTLGKSFDTHGPTGPWLTLPDEIADPHALGIRTWVNDDLRQNGNTRDLLYDVYDQIAYLSQVMTLMPGDILATGTPAGVAIGFDPPKFLKVGDVVRIEIDGLGHLANPVIAQPRPVG